MRDFLEFIAFLKENIGKLSVQAQQNWLLFCFLWDPAHLHKLKFTFLPKHNRPRKVLFDVKNKNKKEGDGNCFVESFFIYL